jgi:glucose uptake protein GlcU
MDVIQAILGGVAAAFVAGAVQIIILKINRNAAQEDAHDQIKNGLKILLYDRLKYLSKRSIEKGRIAIDDLEDLIAMHKIYHDDLSGNGLIDKLMEQVKGLPIS